MLGGGGEGQVIIKVNLDSFRSFGQKNSRIDKLYNLTPKYPLYDQKTRQCQELPKVHFFDRLTPLIWLYTQKKYFNGVGHKKSQFEQIYKLLPKNAQLQYL